MVFKNNKTKKEVELGLLYLCEKLEALKQKVDKLCASTECLKSLKDIPFDQDKK